MYRSASWIAGVCLLLGAGSFPGRAQEAAPKPATAAKGEDPLPAGAFLRLGTVRFRHGEAVAALALSADGKLLASVGSDYEQHVARLWDARTGKLLLTFPRPGSRLAFSPRGDLLAAGGYTTVALVDPSSGKVLRWLEGHKHHVHTLAFSPDGTRLVTASEDETAAVWEIPSGKLLHRCTGIAKGCVLAGFTGDGKQFLVAAKTGIIQVHDAFTFRELRRFETDLRGSDSQAFALSRDGRILAAPTYHGVALWNVATGKRWHEKPPPADKKLSEIEEFIRKSRIDEGVEDLPRKGSEVAGLAFSPDGKHLAAVGGWDDGELCLIDVAKNRVVGRARAGIANCIPVFFPDGKTLATAGHAGVIHLWDRATGRELLPSPGHRSKVLALAFAPDGKTLASADFEDGVLWELPAGRVRQHLEQSGPWQKALAFSPDGKSLAGLTTRGHLHFWDTAAGKLRFRRQPPRAGLDGHSWIVGLAFSPDGTRLASAAIPLGLWDTTQGRPVRVLGKAAMQTAAFTPDGSVLAAGGKVIALWDPATGAEKREFGSGTTYTFLQFVEGGRTLLSGDERGVLSFWTMPRGKLARQLPTGYVFNAVAVSRDGLTAATVGGKYQVRDTRGYLVPSEDPLTVRLWDVILGKEIRRWEGHTATVHAVAFAPDARTVASAGADTSVIVWDATGRRRAGPPALVVPADQDALLRDLKGGNSTRADAATWALVAAGDTGVALLRTRWFQPKSVARKEARPLVDALADDREAVRLQAKRDLEKLGLPGWSVLNEINDSPLPAQVRDRLEEILTRLRPLFVVEVRLQRRSVRILEQVGSPAGRAGLAELARIAIDPVVAAEAQAALARLDHNRTKKER